ncbi:hypothetical protein LI328DRAFT_144049 [Trichoderma asperelloides]|nr:hypothetical protein LI328DRAFT_144049 [Trichoderma asperelloides]
MSVALEHSLSAPFLVPAQPRVSMKLLPMAMQASFGSLVCCECDWRSAVSPLDKNVHLPA